MFGFAMDYRVRNVLKKLKFQKNARMTHLISLRDAQNVIQEMKPLLEQSEVNLAEPEKEEYKFPMDAPLNRNFLGARPN